jgi:hypothetical protein
LVACRRRLPLFQEGNRDRRPFSIMLTKRKVHFQEHRSERLYLVGVSRASWPLLACDS